MVEKIASAAVDYLKFTIGAMLLATACLFLYAYIFSPAAEHPEDFGAVWHSLEIALASIFAVKMLTSVFYTEARRANRLRAIGLERLSHVQRVILSVASVFLSINVLVMLMQTFIQSRQESVDFRKRR